MQLLPITVDLLSADGAYNVVGPIIQVAIVSP
jgi:hypothetical protein